MGLETSSIHGVGVGVEAAVLDVDSVEKPANVAVHVQAEPAVLAGSELPLKADQKKLSSNLIISGKMFVLFALLRAFSCSYQQFLGSDFYVFTYQVLKLVLIHHTIGYYGSDKTCFTWSVYQ